MKSDVEVQRDVMAELQWEPSVNAAQIGVLVSDGVVTLDGHVDSYAEKWDAERAAQRVAGVKALAIELDVRLSVPNRRDDADIARSAENVLQWTTYWPESIDILVENGWITLTGEVDWEYQRQAAAAAVRYLMGVKGVSNRIVVMPQVSRSAVKADIEAALKRRATHGAEAVAVEVRGADVTLSGTVHSWSEREVVRNSAWGAPGVANVVDNLVVAG